MIKICKLKALKSFRSYQIHFYWAYSSSGVFSKVYGKGYKKPSINKQEILKSLKLQTRQIRKVEMKLETLTSTLLTQTWAGTRNIMQVLPYANTNPPRDKQFTSPSHRAGSGQRWYPWYPTSELQKHFSPTSLIYPTPAGWTNVYSN